MNEGRSYIKQSTLSNMCSLTRTRDFVTFKKLRTVNPLNLMKTLEFNFWLVFLDGEIRISRAKKKRTISFNNPNLASSSIGFEYSQVSSSGDFSVNFIERNFIASSKIFRMRQKNQSNYCFYKSKCLT